MGMKRTIGAAPAVVICLVLLAAGYAAGQNTVGGKVLRAESLELTDSAGRVRAVLRASSDGLEVRRPDGKVRAMVGFALDDVAALTLVDDAGHGRIAFGMTPDGQHTDITLVSQDHTGLISLDASKGGPALYLKSGDHGKSVELDDEGRLVSSMGCGGEPHVLAPASPPVCN